MILKCIPRQPFILFSLSYYKRFFFFFFFVSYHIFQGIERLSNCYTSDETQCLCVGFEKSNRRDFKFKP